MGFGAPNPGGFSLVSFQCTKRMYYVSIYAEKCDLGTSVARAFFSSLLFGGACVCTRGPAAFVCFGSACVWAAQAVPPWCTCLVFRVGEMSGGKQELGRSVLQVARVCLFFFISCLSPLSLLLYLPPFLSLSLI